MPAHVTLKQVAAEANVSYQTVSKVLNRQVRLSKETEGRIREAARTLGYHPDLSARNLRLQRSGLLGYSRAASSPHDPNPILDLFLASMVDAAERSGYHVLPFPRAAPGGEIEAYQKLIRTRRVDGFILSSVESHDPRVDFLLEEDFPFVAFGRAAPAQDIPFVDVDGAAGVAMATGHLLRLGHRRIALLGWPTGSRVGDERLAGYCRALEAAGIAPRLEWIARGEGRVAFGQAAAARWLDRDGDERPTAIVALNDWMAVGAMRAARERNLRVGIDISITGFDDVPMAPYLSPPLTSVRQPIWLAGQKVVRMLTGLLNGQPPAPRQLLLAPRLVVRESSGPGLNAAERTG